MEVKTIKIENPQEFNIILGNAHFIKTVEDIHEVLVGTVPGIEFGLAFCEASGPALVRYSGTKDALIELATKNMLNLAVGHSFLVILGNVFPINVLNGIKMVPEVTGIYCATANPVEVIVAETETGRGIMGVIDGVRAKGIETEADITARQQMLRQFGYKLGG